MGSGSVMEETRRVGEEVVMVIARQKGYVDQSLRQPKNGTDWL